MKYSTKMDKNGNRYQMAVDEGTKTFEVGYFLFWGEGDIVTTKKNIKLLAQNLVKNGYKEA